MFAELIAHILSIIEDIKFWKKKKERRKFEKENNLPKKLMIHPLWKLLGILLIFIFLAKFAMGHFFFSNHGEKKTIEKITEIELILEKEKSSSGNYPEKLNTIIRNNPFRKNITSDYWDNEFFYEQKKNGSAYVLISKGKDGILNTEDDINGIRNLP
jgi:amino acid transporter